MTLTSPPARSLGRNQQLDGLRAVSVLFVIISHFALMPRGSDATGTAGQFLVGLGWLGVQIFFCISGFVITRMQLEEKARHGYVNLRAFYVRRFFRIIPAYWTYLLAVALLTAMGVISVTPNCFIRSLLFVSNVQSFPPAQGWFVGHSWTLSVEEQYYLVLPILFWSVLKGKRRVILIALGLLYFVTIYENRLTRLNLPFDPAALSFIFWFKYIIAGVFLAMIWDRALPVLKRTPLLVCIAVLGLLMMREYYVGLDHLKVTTCVQAVEALALAFVIGWFATHQEAFAILRIRPVQWVGRASFSLYLWQQLFAAPDDFYHGVVLSTWPVNVLLLVTAAALSYYFIERPCIQFGKAISNRLTEATPALPQPEGLVPLTQG